MCQLLCSLPRCTNRHLCTGVCTDANETSLGKYDAWGTYFTLMESSHPPQTGFENFQKKEMEREKRENITGQKRRKGIGWEARGGKVNARGNWGSENGDELRGGKKRRGGVVWGLRTQPLRGQTPVYKNRQAYVKGCVLKFKWWIEPTSKGPLDQILFTSLH